MKEVWKQIPFETKYEVSSLGRVRNIETKHVKGLRLSRAGYPRVTLYPSGKTYMVHRLVMMTFEPDNVNEHINHINGNPRDNRLKNLEWCTASHNMRHQRTVLGSHWVGQMNPSTDLTYDDAVRIKTALKVFTAKEVAKMFGLLYERVRRIKTGQHWSHVEV